MRVRVGRVVLLAAAVCVALAMMVGAGVYVVQRSSAPPSVSASVSGKLPSTLWPMTTLSHRPGTGKPEPKVARSLGQLGAPVSGRKVVALSFDDGPGPDTPAVLRALHTAGVQATFFTIGKQVRQHPRTVRRLQHSGMSVQTHTQHHANLSRLSRRRIRAELTPAAHAVRRATGRQVRCVRPPYNAWSPRSRKTTARLGLHSVSYDVDPRDWAAGQKAGSIAHNVVRQVHPGSIILLHDGGRRRTQTVHAIPKIVAKLRQRGYRFVLMC